MSSDPAFVFNNSLDDIPYAFARSAPYKIIDPDGAQTETGDHAKVSDVSDPQFQKLSKDSNFEDDLVASAFANRPDNYRNRDEIKMKTGFRAIIEACKLINIPKELWAGVIGLSMMENFNRWGTTDPKPPAPKRQLIDRNQFNVNTVRTYNNIRGHTIKTLLTSQWTGGMIDEGTAKRIQSQIDNRSSGDLPQALGIAIKTLMAYSNVQLYHAIHGEGGLGSKAGHQAWQRLSPSQKVAVIYLANTGESGRKDISGRHLAQNALSGRGFSYGDRIVRFLEGTKATIQLRQEVRAVGRAFLQAASFGLYSGAGNK